MATNKIRTGQILTTSEAWSTWIPTWTNLTIGNGTNYAHYLQVGKFVYFQLITTFGTTTTMGSLPTFTLPVTSVTAPTSVVVPIAFGNLTAAGGNTNGWASWASTTTALLRYWDTNNNLGNVTATQPATWASNSNNIVIMQGCYEAA